MSKVKLSRWDPAEYVESAADAVAYLDAAFEEDDPQLVAAVLGDIARAFGITEIATATGLGHEDLHESLSPNGNPELGTVLQVMRVAGLRLHASLADDAAA